MDTPFRALFKILRYPPRIAELALGSEHVARLEYFVQYPVVFIFVGYIEIDFDLVQRELMNDDVVEPGFIFLLDRLL